MEISGKIVEIYATNEVSDRFRKREFVIEYSDNPQYPQFIKLEFVNDACDELDKFGVGKMVNVAFNLRGRKWVNPQGEAVYFNTIQAWKISPVGDTGTVPPPQPDPPFVTDSGKSDDDLPF